MEAQRTCHCPSLLAGSEHNVFSLCVHPFVPKTSCSCSVTSLSDGGAHPCLQRTLGLKGETQCLLTGLERRRCTENPQDKKASSSHTVQGKVVNRDPRAGRRQWSALFQTRDTRPWSWVWCQWRKLSIIIQWFSLIPLKDADKIKIQSFN